MVKPGRVSKKHVKIIAHETGLSKLEVYSVLWALVDLGYEANIPVVEQPKVIGVSVQAERGYRANGDTYEQYSEYGPVTPVTFAFGFVSNESNGFNG